MFVGWLLHSQSIVFTSQFKTVRVMWICTMPHAQGCVHHTTDYNSATESAIRVNDREKASERFAISWILFYSLVIIIMIKTDYSSHLEWAQTASSSSCTFYLRFRPQPPPQWQHSSKHELLFYFYSLFHHILLLVA